MLIIIISNTFEKETRSILRVSSESSYMVLVVKTRREKVIGKVCVKWLFCTTHKKNCAVHILVSVASAQKCMSQTFVQWK